ncbi:NAD-dependent epimerase/dehydratase family protein [Wohlfahrtiimonas chitiniclastica]|uniref:NAD-dependent epimerase/dehydratase family protein n=1 Tax=Wohlfahrtiimonas chitiniclastica TaxID=400946 RepID=UPI0007B69931|nr:NAD(P)-dependent oxidoreductase [Wohlfahrtiimonas chitiniclastica]KZX36421.1 hypothetical protein A6V30_08495 [Wohlfahrtiimonas chitiniclastica]
MKVLLTGASGFIGGHILNALVNKYGKDSIVVLTSKKISSIHCIVYDSFNDFGVSEDCFNDITHIIHAGAFTPKDTHQANNLTLCFENVQFTKNLLSYNFHALSRVVNISTLDVYADTRDKLNEGSKIRPISLYGSSKFYCEEMIKAFSNQQNVSYINLRIGHVYGPGEEKYKKVIPVAIQNIIENKPIELWGDGSDLRSFIFIEDVVESILNSLEIAEENLDINVVSGVSVSIYDLLHKIISVSEQSVQLHQKESNHEKRDLIFDNSRLLKTLLNKETNLMQGLKAEYDYMKVKYENNI